MITPASAPSTPASNEPPRDETFPSSNSAVCSPRYQTLPSPSCAYQSKVSSITSPSEVTVSRTTRAVTPFAIRFVALLTVTRTSSAFPSSSSSRYVQRVPGVIGQ